MPAQTITQAVDNIRSQLSTNLLYFEGKNQALLEVLQGHIEDHLKDIERLSAQINTAAEAAIATLDK